jgi:diaminohydroxyphosphoribosylaminopyrimidine deaminase/5-amino-6-(5-phosphoribosylamino)uracil reductase
LDDRAFMGIALGLARRGHGLVWPNPTVGCVLVQDGELVGRGWTQPGGRPHAEAEALRRAGPRALGATAFVTLEPCCHWGQTPPCTEALAAAGVARVVLAIADPDPRVCGKGVAALRTAGIAVETGLGAEAATEINAGFLSRVRRGRPLVTLKLATTLDGRIATATGQSRWITGEAARARAHLLRATHDAVMIGSGTALADDPELTCRLNGLEGRSPVRIVVDGRGRVPPDARLVATARQTPTWFLMRAGVDEASRRALADCGVEVIEVEARAGGGLDLAQALAALGARGLTRLLVEGGGGLAAALVAADLVDRVAWFRAPCLVGGDGRPALGPFGVTALAAAPRFERVALEEIGEDVLETLRRAP